ncbi:hypothetical protein BVY04_01025 [bacterium M21]|nr:hypothetical protein BVY04_01025 [bacterium M21]
MNMYKSTKDMRIAVFPEGPIAFNGRHYCYSKGERLYLDNLAASFKSVTIISFVFREGDDDYEGCSHSEFQAKNLDVIELPFNASAKYGVIGKFIHFARVYALMLRVVKNFELLYVFLPSYPSAMAWSIGRLRRIPHITYVADDWEQASPCMFRWEKLRNTYFYTCFLKFNCWMERSIGKTAVFTVTAGALSKKKFEAFGQPVTETIPRITLGVDSIHDREDTCGNDEIVLINVGGLIFDKAQHILIQAFARAYGSEPRLRLKIVGDGPKMDELKAVAIKEGVDDRVTFTGYILEENILYENYHNADMFVLSSVSEGFPRVLYEAMAMGLPIVTTDCGGIPKLMKDGENGRVLEVDDIEGISKAILDIIQDENGRKALIKNGMSTVRNVLEKANPQQIATMVEQHMFS